MNLPGKFIAFHLLFHILPANGIMHQLSQFTHGPLIHAKARHFLHTNAQTRWVPWIGITGNHVVVDNDIVSF